MKNREKGVPERVAEALEPKELEVYRSRKSHEISPSAESPDEQREEAIEALRRQLRTPAAPKDQESRKESLLGEFAGEERTERRLKLKGAASRSMEKNAASFRDRAKYVTNTITGEPIAAEYDIKTKNFSTQTHIAELADGRKVFIVYDFRGSWMHRGLDTLMKWACDLRMRKATKKEWKTWFEEKSSIPVIENKDPHTVVMPFVPNVNALDVFAHNKEIENFGECAWAENLTGEDKLELADDIMDEIHRVHDQGVAWGETILPNVILTKEKKAVICDPEIRFNDDVPLPEAMARDLKYICMSIGGALATSEQMEPGPVIQRLLDRYGDPEVIVRLQNLVNQKMSILQRLTLPYEYACCGAGNAERYNAIMDAIREYDMTSVLNKHPISQKS